MKDFYSWEQLYTDCLTLANHVKTSGITLTHIYGIPRGGLIPAVILSHALALPLLFDTEMINETVLVVDDICDTGATYTKLSAVLGTHPPFATLYYNKDHHEEPDFWVKEKTNWVIFPWETEESSKYDGTETAIS